MLYVATEVEKTIEAIKNKIMMDNQDDFDWDAYEKAIREHPLFPVKECCRQIEDVLNDSVIRLFISIDNFIFQGLSYDEIISQMPQWIAIAGISPEQKYSKDDFEKLKTKLNHPIFNRVIYYYDLWGKVAGIRDRFAATITYLQQFYEIVPCSLRYENDQYTSVVRSCGPRCTQAHMLLNSIFVSYASIFDILSKVAVEQFEFGKYDFNTYKKMRSTSILYKKSLPNVDPTLKENGMLFSEALVIRQIETLRNEFVHNGPWDLNCCIYNTFVNDELADVIIYGPDMDMFGNFVASGARNKFYSQENRINIQLPNIIQEATVILKNTIEQLSILYQKNTKREIDRCYAKECSEAIASYWQSFS